MEWCFNLLTEAGSRQKEIQMCSCLSNIEIFSLIHSFIVFLWFVAPDASLRFHGLNTNRATFGGCFPAFLVLTLTCGIRDQSLVLMRYKISFQVMRRGGNRPKPNATVWKWLFEENPPFKAARVTLSTRKCICYHHKHLHELQQLFICPTIICTNCSMSFRSAETDPNAFTWKPGTVYFRISQSMLNNWTESFIIPSPPIDGTLL